MPGSSANKFCVGQRFHRGKAIRWSLVATLIGLATTSLSVQAQPPAPTPQGSANAAGASGVLQEVTVTGSRIPVPANITATSPINVVSGQDVQLSGQTDIGNLISLLPQNVISGGVDTGNTSSPLTSTGGFETVDLRGLGPQRTLVLVNGRRLGIGDPSTANPNPSPDIDQIPVPLIQRIDVVTGGASATYGSDAIAGVVNFILRTDFQGLEINGGYSFDQHSQHSTIQSALTDANFPIPSGKTDGGTHDLSIVMGTNMDDGKGNITGYFVYHNQAAVPGSDRDFSACQVASNLPGFVCAGSSNSNRFQINGPGTTRETVVGTSFLKWPQTTSNPP